MAARKAAILLQLVLIDPYKTSGVFEMLQAFKIFFFQKILKIRKE
jgi:hypothetical protein